MNFFSLAKYAFEFLGIFFWTEIVLVLHMFYKIIYRKVGYESFNKYALRDSLYALILELIFVRILSKFSL